ncbi:hypothetical protein EYC80_006892 [Monilinia laxa]|uniref:Uncharacterized protein n=1 Tax=Monilinia laxa TaxID=61186 RepID=A0A5N6JZW1_MONLA|nr:hypothetical protein EYC80_006892 [Monilinia laxa]
MEISIAIAMVKKQIKHLASHQGNLLDPLLKRFFYFLFAKAGKIANRPPCKLGNLGDSFSLIRFPVGAFVTITWG